MKTNISCRTGLNSLRRLLIAFWAIVVFSILGLWGIAWAAEPVTQPQALHGTEFHLEIAPLPVNITGKPAIATAINGQVPAPTLYWREGDTVTLHVTNRLPDYSSVHWHGILLPANMDGVPGLSFDGIAPGETFTYQFKVKQSGTYWYHSHSRFQEQTGLYGPIVILPKEGERIKADREHVVMLSDWTDDNPEKLFDKLKKMSDFFNFNQPTLGNFIEDVSRMGLKGAIEKRHMWNMMRMLPTDFSDVSAAPGRDISFSYLVNGKSAEQNWTGLFKPGEKVRLRFINGSATTIFDVRIPGLKMTVISTDGQDVEPVPVDEFRISVAETYDVLVEPVDDRAYTVFAQSISRSGYVRGTLAPEAGLQAAVPAVDEPQWLTMADMMGAMDHGAHQSGSDNKPSASGMQGKAASAGADHSSMPGTQHGPAGGTGHEGTSANQHGASPDGNHGGQAGMNGNAAPPVRHARTEYGPNVDMRVDMPRTNLDDPGINLRDNGRRVLTYADLHTIGGPLDPRPPEREIELHITGHMERFVWSFDGQKFSEALPIHLRYGERVRVVLVNDTMMNHPIHLHGMWMELESPDGKFQVRKHTINVQPAQRITFLVTANALGRWAFHCHLLYHMEAGMFREMVVS